MWGLLGGKVLLPVEVFLIPPHSFSLSLFLSLGVFCCCCCCCCSLLSSIYIYIYIYIYIKLFIPTEINLFIYLSHYCSSIVLPSFIQEKQGETQKKMPPGPVPAHPIVKLTGGLLILYCTAKVYHATLHRREDWYADKINQRSMIRDAHMGQYPFTKMQQQGPVYQNPPPFFPPGAAPGSCPNCGGCLCQAPQVLATGGSQGVVPYHHCHPPHGGCHGLCCPTSGCYHCHHGGEVYDNHPHHLHGHGFHAPTGSSETAGNIAVQTPAVAQDTSKTTSPVIVCMCSSVVSVVDLLDPISLAFWLSLSFARSNAQKKATFRKKLVFERYEFVRYLVVVAGRKGNRGDEEVCLILCFFRTKIWEKQTAGSTPPSNQSVGSSKNS
eukprot:gene9485-6655_t